MLTEGYKKALLNCMLTPEMNQPMEHQFPCNYPIYAVVSAGLGSNILFSSIKHVHLIKWSILLAGSSIMANMMPLKDITPAATNTVNTQFILLEKGSITQHGKETTTCLALVADETASVHFQMWGSECEVFEPGDIIRLNNGIFSYHKNNLVLRAGKKGKAEKVGEFTMLFVETPNMSEIHWARDPQNPKKFLHEAVISPHSQIFPPLQ